MINRKLCVGMFILGALSHYDNEEVVKYKSIQYVASTLKKKHFPIRNGTAKQRFQKDIKALLKQKVIWENHASISDSAWKKATDDFSQDNSITVSALILAILRKEESTLEWYGFNKKKLEKYQQSSEFKNIHIFSSSRVATKLLSHLDSEIAYFNYEREKVS